MEITFDLVSMCPFFVLYFARLIKHHGKLCFACRRDMYGSWEHWMLNEIAREKICMQSRNEVPYTCQDGKALKLLATTSRLNIEDSLHKKRFFMRLKVKVKEYWRRYERVLQSFVILILHGPILCENEWFVDSSRISYIC